MARGRGTGRSRGYPRTARVSELCREILADALERLDDRRLEMVTLTHVSVEPDLRHALVYYAALGQGEEEAARALVEHRARLQGAIARQARLKRTPELRFELDQVIEHAARIEAALRRERDRRT
jgi:ribosome-binding factor A